MTVCGDPTQLRLVLTKLAENAIKFTERGRIELRMAPLEADADRVRIRFDVRDTGIGLRPGDQERLFQTFGQADGSVTRRFGGVGLGLAIARERVALMGGEIGVESEPERGSTFWFTAVAKPASAAHPLSAGAERIFAGRRALVVGEAGAEPRQLRRLLESKGLTVSGAEDALTAFAAMEQAWRQGEPFDVAFLGQALEDTPAGKLAARIRRHERFRGTKLVLVHPPGAPPSGAGGEDASDAVLARPVPGQAVSEVLLALFDAGAKPRTGGPNDAVRACESRPPAQSGRVLLAEDNRINRDLVLALLGREAIEADTVANGAEAVEAAARVEYALVLMDVQMPVLDGLEATRRIHALPGTAGRVPIVAVTAHAMRGDRERCLAAGMDDYLAKPIDPQKFLATLARWGLRGKGPAAPERSSVAPDVRPQADGPHFDPASLAGFASVMSPGEVGEMVRTWVQGTRDSLARIGRLAEAGDLAGLAHEAHDLAGTAGTLGAIRIGRCAARLEEACERDDLSDARRLVAEIERDAPPTFAAMDTAGPP